MAYRTGTPTASQFLDENGDPANGHTLEFYVEGTSTPANIAFDTAGSSTATTVTIGTNGFPASGGSDVTVYYDEDVTYDIVRKDSGGVAFGPTVRSYSVTQDIGAGAALGVLSSAGSAANVITASLATTPTLVDQLQVVVELQHGANTAAAVTFNLNSLGAKAVKRDNNQPLAIGDTGGSGYKLYLSYSSANDVWILLNPVNPIGQGLEWKRGLKVTNNATDSEHDIDVASGSILDSTEARIINLPSSITKRIDATFAVGTGNGGLSNQDSLTADTFYGVFLISTATGTTDVIFATTQANALADTVAAAAGYTFARLIDVVLTNNPDANIINTVDGGNDWRMFKVQPIEVSTTASGTAQLEDTPVPPFLVGSFIYEVDTANSVGSVANGYGLLTSTSQTDSVPSNSLYTVRCLVQATGATQVRVFNGVVCDVRVDGSSQIRHREGTDTGTATNISLYCRGWKMDYTITDLV